MNRVKMEEWICRAEGIASLTRQNLEQLQLEKLNTMLSRLKKRGGIFGDLPDHLDDLSQLQLLPFTTPRMLREHPNQFLMCSQSQVSRVISESTSGTTGGAKRVFYTDRDLAHTVDFFASGIHEMLSEGEKCLIAFPFSGPSGLGDLIAEAVKQLGAVPVRAGFGCSFGEMERIIRKEQPETYIGFPVFLLSMIRCYGEKFPIRRALISGDACPEGVSEMLMQTVALYPHYGSREMALGGAVTCPAFEGMHLRENHILAEIIGENGNPVPDGEWGELVITTIGLEAMPLLRYRTGDLTRFLPGPCPCGGVTRRLDRVIRKEKCPISIEELDSHLFRIPQVIDYRAFWEDVLRLEVLVSEDTGDPARVITSLYPDLKFRISMQTVTPEDRPAYPGKRYMIQGEGEKKE